MEELLTKHKENPSVQMIYFPFELSREKALLKGIYRISTYPDCDVDIKFSYYF